MAGAMCRMLNGYCAGVYPPGAGSSLPSCPTSGAGHIIRSRDVLLPPPPGSRPLTLYEVHPRLRQPAEKPDGPGFF